MEQNTPAETAVAAVQQLAAEVTRLRSVCAEAHQFARAHGAPERLLGNLAAAAAGCQDPDSAIGAWLIDKPFPSLLTPAQLRQVFQIGESRYHDLRRLGRYTRFEAPSVGGPLRYSGEKVHDFLRYGHAQARTFGAKRGPRVKKPV